MMDGYVTGTIADPSLTAVLMQPDLELSYFPASALLWLILFWLLQSSFRHGFQLSSFRQKYPFVKDSHIETLTMWSMQLVLGTFFLVIWMAYGGEVMFRGTWMRARTTAVADTDWTQPLQWTKCLYDTQCAWTYAFLPILLLYLFEMVAIPSQDRVSGRSNHLLLTHHAVSLVFLTYGSKALMATLNARWAQFGGAMLLHILTEQPSWLALVFYRLRLPGSAKVLRFAALYEALQRVLIWSFVLYAYAELCWLSCTFTAYEVVWRWLFIPLALIVMTAQFMVWRIHMHMAFGCHSISTSSQQQRLSQVGKKEVEANSRADDPVGLDCAETGSHTVSLEHSVMQADRATVAAKDCASSSQSDSLDLGNLSVSTSHHCHAEKNGSTHRKQAPSLFQTLSVIFTLLLWVLLILFCVVDVMLPNPGIVEVRCRRVGVVGGGIAGLGTAWALSRDSDTDFSVTVFEANERFGGNAYTYYDSQGKGIEVGFTTYPSYPNFEQLLGHLNVSSHIVGTGVTITKEFANGTVSAYATSRMGSSRVRENFADYSAEIDRLEWLMRYGLAHWSEYQWMTTTVVEVLRMYGFSHEFEADYLEPCFQGYVTLSVSGLTTPMAFLREIDGLFKGCITRTGASVRSVTNGSSTYVNRLVEELNSGGVDLRNQATVEAIQGSTRGPVRVRVTREGVTRWEEFDQVVLAVPRKAALRIMSDLETILPAPQSLYESGLGSEESNTPVTYRDVTTVIHSDSSLLSRALAPYKDSLDQCQYGEVYNFYSDESTTSEGCAKWQANRVNYHSYPYKECMPLVPPFLHAASNACPISDKWKPDPSLVQLEHNMTHPAHDVDFFRSGRALHAVQGAGRIWFAGGENAAFNFHEFAFASGLVTAHAIGAEYPWDDVANARAVFQKYRNWLHFGLNPFVHSTVRRLNNERRCDHCV